MLAALLCLFTLCWTSLAIPDPPITIPDTEPGDHLDPAAAGAPIRVDAFLETLCPDSQFAWPVVQQVAQHYGPEVVDVVVHQFPLPYHRWGYLTTQVSFYTSRHSMEGYCPEWIWAFNGFQNLCGYSYNGVCSIIQIQSKKCPKPCGRKLIFVCFKCTDSVYTDRENKIALIKHCAVFLYGDVQAVLGVPTPAGFQRKKKHNINEKIEVRHICLLN